MWRGKTIDNEQSDNQGNSSDKKSRLDNILALPGIYEAINLVRVSAWESAIDKTVEQGFRGEFGDEPKAILESDEGNALDQFIKHKIVTGYFWDSFDELLEEFAVDAGDKVTDLWGLSKSLADLISQVIYNEKYTEIFRQKKVYEPLTLMLREKDSENNKAFDKRYHEFEEQGIEVRYSDHTPKGRIYLDVTELTNQQLRSAYKAVELCRDILEIQHEDSRAGAPKSFDTNKALAIDLLRMSGESNVKIAKQLGFKISKDDYLKDTAPRIFYKYKKLGKEINVKLEALYSYLVDLHPTTSD